MAGPTPIPTPYDSLVSLPGRSRKWPQGAQSGKCGKSTPTEPWYFIDVEQFTAASLSCANKTNVDLTNFPWRNILQTKNILMWRQKTTLWSASTTFYRWPAWFLYVIIWTSRLLPAVDGWLIILIHFFFSSLWRTLTREPQMLDWIALGVSLTFSAAGQIVFTAG